MITVPVLSASHALHSLILSLRKTSAKSLVVLSKCGVPGTRLNHVCIFASRDLGSSGATEHVPATPPLSPVRAGLLGFGSWHHASLPWDLQHTGRKPLGLSFHIFEVGIVMVFTSWLPGGSKRVVVCKAPSGLYNAVSKSEQKLQSTA